MQIAIQPQFKGKLELYVVLAKFYNRNVWRFIRAFSTLHRAQSFVAELKSQVEKGDFSCLTLKN